MNQEAERIGELLAVDDVERRYRQRIGERDADPRLELYETNVLVADQEGPGLVGAQIGSHRARHVQRQGAGGGTLAAEVDQAGVMPHMAVGQKDPVEVLLEWDRPVRLWRSQRVRQELPHLGCKVRCGIEDEPLAGRRVDESNARDARRGPLAAAYRVAVVAEAIHLRNAGILGGAENDGVGRGLAGAQRPSAPRLGTEHISRGATDELRRDSRSRGQRQRPAEEAASGQRATRRGSSAPLW